VISGFGRDVREMRFAGNFHSIEWQFCTDMLFRNVGTELPFYSAENPRRAHISSVSKFKFVVFFLDSSSYPVCFVLVYVIYLFIYLLISQRYLASKYAALN
jgi:hypothetical protein